MFYYVGLNCFDDVKGLNLDPLVYGKHMSDGTW